PIHQSDLTRSIVAALQRHWDGPESLIVAGPEAVAYRDFLAAVATAAGLRSRRVVALPAWLLMAGAVLARPVPLLPTIAPGEIRRLLEDKAFDVHPMRERLGITPITLQEGLRRTFGPVPAGQGAADLLAMP
ncbi:MAG: hypothetical protein ACRYG8_36035, partial [Janthinobacterium lividum]